MKYAVTVETEVEFEFFPHVDKDELLKEFCEYIFEIDMENLERFIARRIAVGDISAIEGIGMILPKWKVSYIDSMGLLSDYVLYYKTQIDGTEVKEL